MLKKRWNECITLERHYVDTKKHVSRNIKVLSFAIRFLKFKSCFKTVSYDKMEWSGITLNF